MDFNKQQIAAIYATEPKVVVISSAAAGKTSLLAERVRYLLSEGVDPAQIVVFSFTNLAAQTLRERIGDVPGLYIGTIHSYANKLLTANGINTKPFIKNEKFDELFPLVKAHLDCIMPVQHLLLDEAQDSDSLQMEFILDMIKPLNWFLVGDHKQSIYNFAGSDPQLLIDLSEQPDVTTYHCDYNYRNGYKILDFAKRIISKAGFDYIDQSIPTRDEAGTIIETSSVFDIPVYIKSHPPYGSWFVLARTNAQVWQIQAILEQNGIPTTTFKQGNLTPAMLEERLQEDKVKVLTIHSSKGLERKHVAVFGPKYFNTEERCVSYVAATRAEDLLLWIDDKRRPKKTTTKKQSEITMTEW